MISIAVRDGFSSRIGIGPEHGRWIVSELAPKDDPQCGMNVSD
jgi:hypothetical protein